MPETLPCEYCGESFEVDSYRKDTARFCSYNCKGLWTSENLRGDKNSNWNGGKKTIECEYCGKTFKAWPSEERRFCSSKCYGPYLSQSKWIKKHYNETLVKYREECGSWNKGLTVDDPRVAKSVKSLVRGRREKAEGHTVKRRCLFCGEEFTASLSEVKAGYGKFCSHRCAAKYRIQHGDPHLGFKKGAIPWNKGKPFDRMKELWSNPSYKERVVKNIIKTLQRKPTEPEQQAIDIIKEHRFPFKYVGDGDVIIGGLNPDFIHTGGESKVLEVFGRAFHDPQVSFIDEIRWHQQYFGRMSYYAQHGYDCLILWDDELGNEEKVVEKVRRFLYG